MQFSQPFNFVPIFEKGTLGSVLSLGGRGAVLCEGVYRCAVDTAAWWERNPMPENTHPHTGSCWFYAQPMEVSPTVSASSTANKFPEPAKLYDPLLMRNTSREEVLISTYFSFLQDVLGKCKSCLPAVYAAAG